MQKLMKALHKNEKGFTLVELMVVVVIIGVLVAIAIPVFNAVTARAELGACQANQRMIEGAVLQYSMGQPEDFTRDEIRSPDPATPRAHFHFLDAVGDGNLPSYFQDGPNCPIDGVYAIAYSVDTAGNVTSVVALCCSPTALTTTLHPHHAGGAHPAVEPGTPAP